MTEVERSLQSVDILERLAYSFVTQGLPDYIRSDIGSGFTAKQLRTWLERLGVSTSFIEPRRPRVNGYMESFRGKLWDECMN